MTEQREGAKAGTGTAPEARSQRAERANKALTTRQRLVLAVLLADSVLLAALELLYLPLRLDGFLLPDLGGFPLPVTAVLAGVTMPWLASVAATLSTRLSVAAAPLLVWLLCLGVFGLAGPGGDILLIADWRALLLLAAGAFPAAVILGNKRA